MTLESQIASLVHNTSNLITSYANQMDLISQLKDQLMVTENRILELEKQLKNSCFYSEMAYSSNYQQISGLNKTEEEALIFKFSKIEDYTPKNLLGEDCFSSLFDSDEEVRYLHDLPSPKIKMSAELHILCTVGEIPEQKNKAFVSIIRRNKSKKTNEDFFENEPSKPNLVIGREDKTVFSLEGFGEKGNVASSTKHVVRNIIRVKDWKNGSHWGGFRFINLGTQKIRVHGLGIILKAEGV